MHSEGSCLSSETNHARNSVQNVIFVFSKYFVMSFLCHHTENFCLRHFVLEGCRTIAICVDRNKIFAKRLHMTTEYTFDLAVRDVEQLNVSRFITGVHILMALSLLHTYICYTPLLPFQKAGLVLMLSKAWRNNQSMAV